MLAQRSHRAGAHLLVRLERALLHPGRLPSGDALLVQHQLIAKHAVLGPPLRQRGRPVLGAGRQVAEEQLRGDVCVCGFAGVEGGGYCAGERTTPCI
eukprot:355731-Chlamydomonas_euryale.AAC.1